MIEKTNRYLLNGDELYHYGVIGMRWGVHRAKRYAADTHNYIRKQKNKAALVRLKSGDITGEQYINARIKNRGVMTRKNQKVAAKLSKLTPDKEKKISSIYEKYRNEAINTIPHYKLKKGAKKVGSLLVSLGTSSVSVVTAGMIPVGLALNTTSTIAKKFAVKRAIKAVEDPVIDAAADYIQNRVFKKKGAPKK